MSRYRKPTTRLNARHVAVVTATLVAAIGLGNAAAAAGPPAHGAKLPAHGAKPAATTAHASKAGHDQVGEKAGAVDDDAGEKGVCANCSPPLIYHNGPVMGTSTPSGTITVTPIYWAPGGNSSFDTFDPTYRTVINRYITDTAAASGTTSNVYGILPEYYSTASGVNTNIKYSIAAGTPITDTTAYPTVGQCTPVPIANGPALVNNYTACITDSQLRTELSAVIAANGLPKGLSNIYVMFFPPNVETQLSFVSPPQYSNANYCGYHASFGSGASTVVYANEPFPVYCDTGGYPDGDVYADMEISTLSHELSEAFTDPTAGSWFDSSGNEIGDECAYNYGPPLGTVSTVYGPQPYNQVINGHDYYTQTEFSNAAYAATGIGTGCRPTPFSPAPLSPATASIRRLAPQDQDGPGTAGVTSMVTVDASPPALPADGTSTSTITITATDSNGDPVAGDSMTVFTRDDNATPGACGALSNDSDVDGDAGDALITNAAGQVTVTYTASTISSDCYILATDNTVGTTNQAVIYQGTDDSTAPSVTETLPATLVSGGPTATFTATATNQASTDIADARFDLYITGDDSGSTGLDASQLRLSYKDDATGGDFVNVPLSGSTADGGVIDGFVIPDKAESLAAGATRTATFQLTLADGAADTAVTGTPLDIETDLDQIDPADGSQSNLDRTAPGAVPVVQVGGDTITYSGKLVTTAAPSGSTPGTAVLVAKDCTFASDGAACRLTGTETFTSSGGTLTGTVTTDTAAGVADRIVTFTETFTASSPTAGTGTGTAQLIYLDNGNTSSDVLAAAYTTAPDTSGPGIQAEHGTITLTRP
jgi:hypothetical protein